jgi:hypothetical protein
MASPSAPTPIKVTFISETGFPHAAVRVGSSDWYGFKPNINKCPVCPGHVDHSDRTTFIKSSVTFEFPNEQATRATVNAAVATYNGTWYRGSNHDCVNLAYDVAKALGLSVPSGINLFPDNFVKNLNSLNATKVKAFTSK